jgi:Beta-ketoacyl synthase, N-terminal domain
MKLFVNGVGVFGTGLPNWSTTQSVLSGAEPYLISDLPIVIPAPDWLPAAERRRTSDIIRLALCSGREALTQAEQDISGTHTVFSSSGGSGEVIHQICEALALPDREVSPTRFHNSVHNAPAGYWGIATRSEWPSTSLCAHDFSFAAAVLESCAQVASLAEPVLLLAHDLRYPEPLNQVRTVNGLFSVAFVLTHLQAKNSLFVIDVDMVSSDSKETLMSDPSLETFRLGNPAARCLPLLQAMASASLVTAPVIIASMNGGRISMKVSAVQ